MKTSRWIFISGAIMASCSLVGCEQRTLSMDESMRSLATTTRYVSTSGDDSNDGSMSAPLRTLNHALTLSYPGDSVVVRTGTYNEKVFFPRSGTTDAYITLCAYTGEQPLISGEGLSSGGHEALVTISSVDWIRIADMEVANFSTDLGGRMLDGILVTGTSSHIVLEGNHVHHIHNNADPAVGREAHGIHIKGTGTSPMTDIRVESNEIHNNRTGTSENLTVNGYVDGFIVKDNEIYNGENIAICVAGGYGANGTLGFDYARNGLVSGNRIWNIDGKTGQVPVLLEAAGTIGIYVDGARNITVERNRIWDSDRGIGLVSENDGFPTEFCIVRNNIVYHNRAEGIYLGGYANYTTGGTKSCLVLNNTLYQNGEELGYNDEEVGEIRLNSNCHFNEIHNNIVVARPDRGTFIRKTDNTGSYNGIDYNLYYTTGSVNRWFWDGTPIIGFSAWQGGTGGDTNGTYADPVFTAQGATPPDFSLTSTSPAINSGNDFHGPSAGDVDANDQPRYNSTIDIGALEYQ